jgi:hypothetical protein
MLSETSAANVGEKKYYGLTTDNEQIEKKFGKRDSAPNAKEKYLNRFFSGFSANRIRQISKS